MKIDYKKRYESLQEEFEKYKRESIKWSVEDFTTMEKEGWSITKKQAQEALEDMIRRHDAQYGISWDTVEYYIEEYGKKAKRGKELWRKELKKLNINI